MVECPCPLNSDSGGEHGPVEHTDAAGKSLSDALRVSFRLLTVIMIVMVILFISTGFRAIKSNEVGIVKVFGRVIRTARPGATYNWPFPIGQIEIVKTDLQNLIIKDFWMHETARDETIKLENRRVVGQGLRPGWDGAFLTGDRFLLHVKLDCSYKIVDPVAFRKHIADNYVRKIPGLPEGIETNPKEETIRFAVCSAAIRTAATWTADNLRIGDRKLFVSNLRKLANGALDQMETGLEIKRVEFLDLSWPLRALPAYSAAQRASLKADELKNKARSLAEEILRKTSGQSYVMLVGHPWGIREAIKKIDADKNKDYDLIGKYAKVLTASRKAEADDKDRAKVLLAEAEKILNRIDDILGDRSKISGEASTMISQARIYETNTIQQVKARADRFEKLLPRFRESPQYFVLSEWWKVRGEILGSPKMEKYYLPNSKEKIVIRISKDPEITRKRLRAKLQTAGNRQ